MRRSWSESSARERIVGLLDSGSFTEFLPPQAKLTSPHLEEFDMLAAFDDGVVVGRGLIEGSSVLVVAQEGAFMGGAVGEVHGAKITGLLQRALDDRPAAVLLLVESGGVRLHEANAGLIAISEIMRALLALRREGIRTLALDGGRYGCFGGMGIVARLCDAVIISEEGRLGLSGPEVIETVGGVEAFDASDKAMVWRTMGGKHRYLLGEAAALAKDDISSFRAETMHLLQADSDFSLASLQIEHAQLARRLAHFGDAMDAVDIWTRLGIEYPALLPLLEHSAFMTATAGKRA